MRFLQVFGVWLLSGLAQAQYPEEIALNHDGVARTFYVYVPEDRPEASALVVAMHGYGSNAESIMAYSGLNALADTHGLIVAYPQGTLDKEHNAFFNVGYHFHRDSTVDDVDFIRHVVNYIGSHYSIRAQEVFATGMSNGGDMSYLLACQAADVFRAVAPVAGTMMESQWNDCQPIRPLSVLAISGTADNVTWYAGDPENVGGWGAYLGVESVVKGWVERLGKVHMATDRKAFPHDDPIDVFFHTAERGAEQVVLYRVEGGGHDWPGARFKWWDLRRLVARYAMGFGKHQGFDASAEIVAFFNQYRVYEDS